MSTIAKNDTLIGIYKRMDDFCNNNCIHLVTAAKGYVSTGGEGDPITEVFDDVFEDHCSKGCPISDFCTFMSSGCDAQMGRSLKNLFEAIGWEEEDAQ